MNIQKQVTKTAKSVAVLSVLALTVSLTACGGEQAATDGNGTPTADNVAAGGSNLSGTVVVDGSSTVFPISEAMAEEFQKANPGVRVTVAQSGTGGGFKKFCNNETDISNASRPIRAEEIEACKKGGVEYIELPIAFDGISVVVNPQNNWAKCLTVAQLNTMWGKDAQGKINNWNQIDPKFPDQKLSLYGPGTDSGTYDFFTKGITGKEGESRGDFTASEDDNTLVQGVAGDKGGLGFFGYAYYFNNKEKLSLVAIDNGKGCVEPNPDTISNGTYQPLSRPEFIYVKKSSASRPEVKAFVDFHLAKANQKLVSEVGYVPLPDDLIAQVQARFEKGTVGSVFEGGSKVGVTIRDLLKKE